MASLLIAEMASYCKLLGISLYDKLQKLYKKYDFFYSDMISYTLKRNKGLGKIKNAMSYIRKNRAIILRFPYIKTTTNKNVMI